MESGSISARLQFDESPETLAESDVIAAVSSPDLGLRLRAIHAIASLSASISLPTLFIICQPNNPCQTTAWLSCAELCNIASQDLSLLPQILPSILSMTSATSQRCSRTIRIPLHKLISCPDIDPSAKKSLLSLAAALDLEYAPNRKRPAPSLERVRPSSRNPAEDRLVHERLDNFQLQSQIELILRCVRLNLPNVEPLNLKDDKESIKRLLHHLLEQDALARDPRLRDPRLRSSVIISDSQLAADLELVTSAFDKMNDQINKSDQAAAILAKKSVPEIPIKDFDEEYRLQLRDLAFERMISSCSKSRITEAITAQMLVKYDTKRITQLLVLFQDEPGNWLEVILQLGYALVASGLTEIYIESITTVLNSLWSSAAGTLSKFLCTCALLPDEAIHIIDQICQSDNELKRTVVLFALRDIILKRHADKSKILQLLLTYCASINASLRNPAVALVTHQLLPLGHSVEVQIINYAIQLFTTISEPFEVEIQDRVKAEEAAELHHDDEEEDMQEITAAEQSCPDTGLRTEQDQPDSQMNEGVSDSAEADRSEASDTSNMRSSVQESMHEQTADQGPMTDSTDLKESVTVSKETEEGHDENSSSSTSRLDALIEAEASRRLDLYFALCSERHDMFPRVLDVFSLVSSRGTFVRSCFHKNIPKLVRSIGSHSPVLMAAFKQSPSGSEPLVLHALHVLTDGVEDMVSPALVDAAQSCYIRCRDARFLIPVLSGMKRAQILEALPHIVALPKIHVEQAFRLLLGVGTPVSPSEVLVRLHIIAPTPDHPLLRKVMDAIQLCIFNKEAYNEKVLAVVLQQVVERNPIPVLFMRTLIQVLAVYPLLTEFAITILARLVNKRIWDLGNLELWQGFIVCCMRTAPHSYPIMLQLPSSKLAQLIERSKEPNTLRVELARFVQNSRVEVRRSIQSLLGLTRRLR